MGGGVLHLGNPGGRGDQVNLEIQVGGGAKKRYHPSGGCGFFLARIYNITLAFRLNDYTTYLMTRAEARIKSPRDMLLY